MFAVEPIETSPGLAGGGGGVGTRFDPLACSGFLSRSLLGDVWLHAR